MKFSRNFRKFRRGQKCPKCKKGKLEIVPGESKKESKGYFLLCKTCHFCNF